jgi:hypothetical protein
MRAKKKKQKGQFGLFIIYDARFFTVYLSFVLLYYRFLNGFF